MSRGDLHPAPGVRFEEVIIRQIAALAEASGVTYSEMTRILVDEAILARLARPADLDQPTLREAVLHAIGYRQEPQIDINAEYVAMMQEQGEWD